MNRLVLRELPNGEKKNVLPFHMSMKGLEKTVLCRDDEDYDIMVKYIALCARRKNVIIIIYAVVSNHCHAAVLAARHEDAHCFAQELKRMYSQWFSIKYNEQKVLQRVSVQAVLMENDWHVRNTLAYIPRNALDNGCRIQDYLWTGYRAMFSGIDNRGKRVSLMTRREKESILHTHDCLDKVNWMVDENGHLIPGSFCDNAYLEQVFNNDQVFFLKVIGQVNTAELEEKNVEAPSRMMPDAEFYKTVSDLALNWFGCELSNLPMEKRLRMLPYLWRSRKTTVNQLARVLGLDRDIVRKALSQK